MPGQLASHARPRRRRVTTRRQEWQALHDVADAAFPAMRALFNRAWAAMAATVDEAALRRALVGNNLPEVLVLLEDAWARSTDATLREPLRQLMTGLVTRGAEATQPGLQVLLGPRVPASAVAFNTASPFVEAFIRDHSATLIRGIGDETRQAIRTMLLENMEQGRGWQALARELRETIGVTERQAAALAALRTRAEIQGLKPAQIDRLVASKTRTYKRLRARTIARDQTLLVANNGQQLLWQDLQQRGVLDPQNFKRHLVITPDDRLCNICKQAKRDNIAGVGLNEPFQTENGPIMVPPLHVICRCTVVLKRVL